MHLRVLKLTEKKALLDLAFLLFNLDDCFNEHEDSFMKIYSHATMLDLQDYKPKKKSLQQILLKFKDSSFIVKKAIFYEITMLIHNEHIPSDKENKFLDILKNEWSISEELFRDASKSAINVMNKQTNSEIQLKKQA